MRVYNIDDNFKGVVNTTNSIDIIRVANIDVNVLIKIIIDLIISK